MNKISGQRAKARPFDRIALALATLLATSLLVNSAPAGPPLRAIARTIYVPLGDHLGVNANSYIYEYDPQTKTLHQRADVQSAVKGFKPGDFGYGKVHGRLNEDHDGGIYFATYWGQWRTESEHFEGDRVFRYDPPTQKLTDLGMPLFGWGYPSTHMDAGRHAALCRSA